MCVFYLSTALSKRVLPVCQPNGQKLGQSELFSSFLGGEETFPGPSLWKEARTPLSRCTLMTLALLCHRFSVTTWLKVETKGGGQLTERSHFLGIFNLDTQRNVRVLK